MCHKNWEKNWEILLLNSWQFGIHPDDKSIIIHTNTFSLSDHAKYMSIDNENNQASLELIKSAFFKNTKYADDILNVKVERIETQMLIMWWITTKLHNIIEPNKKSSKYDIEIDIHQLNNTLKKLI